MLLSVENLTVRFHTRRGVVRAVDGVSFEIEKGRALGIVGESGSGKSVSCLALMGLLPVPPARIESGRARFDGRDLLTMDPESLRQIRGRRISMIFQEPMTSLNPYMTIGDQLIEIVTTHERVTADEASRRSVEMLDRVGIPDPAARLRQHPHEFSGGMRQRVMIAMALLNKPDLLIADEPTTALDVTIQAQILELLRELKREMGMSVILISHAMGVVADVCDDLLVMYAGRIAERGCPATIFQKPRHPYTRALIDSMPDPDPRGGKHLRLDAIPGAPPDLTNLPAGCSFAPRCSHVMEVCRSTDPAERPAETPVHAFRCHADI